MNNWVGTVVLISRYRSCTTVRSTRPVAVVRYQVKVQSTRAVQLVPVTLKQYSTACLSQSRHMINIIGSETTL